MVTATSSHTYKKIHNVNLNTKISMHNRNQALFFFTSSENKTKKQTTFNMNSDSSETNP